MELAPGVHEGHGEGRAVPGGWADGAHSLGRRFWSDGVSVEAVLFPPVGAEVHV